jgi:hypothetical protein
MDEIIKYLLDSKLTFKIVGQPDNTLTFIIQGRDSLKFDMEKCTLEFVTGALQRQIESIIKTIS